MIKEIIFDFDGTIADSFDLIVKTMRDNKEYLGIKEIGKKEIERFKNEGFRELLKEAKIPFYKLPRYVKHQQQEINKNIDKIKSFEGIKKMLLELKSRDLVLGIMSSNSEENINKFLKVNKLELFDYVVGKGSIFGKDKVIKSILKSRGLKSGEVLYVGDEIRDVEACKKLGIKIVSVTWGFNTESVIKKYNPDYLIKKPKDILKIAALN